MIGFRSGVEAFFLFLAVDALVVQAGIGFGKDTILHSKHNHEPLI